MKRIALILLIVLGLCFHVFGFCSAADDSGDAENLTYLIVGFDDAAKNTDVIMLLNYNANENKGAIVQIPRDTYCNTGAATDRINSIYPSAIAAGKKPHAALSELARTISENLCVDIDGYAGLTTDAFARLIDHFGGLDIVMPYDFQIETDGGTLDLKKGENHLDGKRATEFVRYRKGYAMGDVGRVDAQKFFLSAFVKKLRSGINLDTAVKCMTDSGEGLVTNVKTRDVLKILMKKSGSLREMNAYYVTLPGKTVQESGVWYYVIAESPTDNLFNTLGFFRRGKMGDNNSFAPSESLGELLNIYRDGSIEPRIFNDENLSGLRVVPE